MQINAHALYTKLLSDLRHEVRYSNLQAYRKVGPSLLQATHVGFREANSLHLLSSFIKKLVPDEVEKADSHALLSFLESNHLAKTWKLVLEDDHDALLYGELKRTLYNFYEPYGCPLISSDFACLDEGRVGPGSSLGSSGQHVYNKLFSGPLTTSRYALYEMYSHYIKCHPDWEAAEMQRISLSGNVDVVEASSLGFVPKESTTSRVICTEKSLDMYYQLGLASIVNKRLKSYWGIDLETQQFKNREIARLGSLCGFDGLKYCTIDLKHASDMSYEMARSVYPKSIFYYLDRYRSEKTCIPGLGTYKLDILSSMGNGYTFSMQTSLFAAIILTCYRINGIVPSYPRGYEVGNFGVFGDDMAFDSRCEVDVRRLLNILGFRINASKSYVCGPFRESCGEDYYKGVNIRGVYIKRLQSQQDRYNAINALNRWSARTGIYLPRTLTALYSSVTFKAIPFWENPDAGIQLPWSLSRDHVRVSKRGTFMYYAYRPVRVGWRIKDSGFTGPRHLIKALQYNPFGLYLSFLRGAFTDGFASVRCTNVKYVWKRLVCPSWDYEPCSWIPGEDTKEKAFVLYQRPFSWERWNTAIYSNLSRS